MSVWGDVITGWIRTALQAGMAACLLFMSIALFIWSADDTPPIEFTAPIELVTPEVRPGGVLRYWIHARRVRGDCHGTTYRTLVGPAIYDLPSRRSWSIGEERVDIIVPVPIPADAMPGQYTLRTWAEYACNPLQGLMPMRVSSPAVRFRVVAP